MKAHDRVLEGIEAAVERHWRFTKDLLHVKPEYLFTVSIADALTKGFDDISGIDLRIKLEEPTEDVTSDLVFGARGLKGLFSELKRAVRENDPGKILVDRDGRVDIYVARDAIHRWESWIVEVKGFNPSWAEVRKDVLRLCQFLLRGGKEHNCKQCFLGFPTERDQKVRIEQEVLTVDGAATCQIEVHSKYVETGEDPEDGMPAFYANCIVIDRRTTGGAVEATTQTRV